MEACPPVAALGAPQWPPSEPPGSPEARPGAAASRLSATRHPSAAWTDHTSKKVCGISSYL